MFTESLRNRVQGSDQDQDLSSQKQAEKLTERQNSGTCGACTTSSKLGDTRLGRALRPYVFAVMGTHHDSRFQRRRSIYQKRNLQENVEKKSWSGPASETIYGGISAASDEESGNVAVALAIRDTTYLLDFTEHHFPIEDKNSINRRPSCDIILDFSLQELRRYETEHLEKFVGIAMSSDIAEYCPTLCSRIWAELDIVPLVLRSDAMADANWTSSEPGTEKTLDEQAESVARKCLTFFGPDKSPMLQVGFRGNVEVDAGFHARFSRLPDYERTVGPGTWNAVNKYAADIKKRNIKIAFFSATPQGGGVALMRHALVRFANVLGVDMKWYVPRPRPGVFRITKTNHNILQGVAKPEDRFTEENKSALTEWIVGNAKRYWLGKGGPLEPPSKGGADLIIIDDPQMPGLIPLIKETTPDRPVIYRSHIQIRSDLISDPNSPQAEVWRYFWNSIKHADLFLSHPVSSFVPNNVPPEMVGYLPAATDWLDGLNKKIDDWDIGYYGRVFNAKCREIRMTTINYPEDEYIVQIARFDPSKGIFDVLKSYAAFFDLLQKNEPNIKPPKLLVCGHGSVDDPDGVAIYDAVIEHLDTTLRHLKSYICVMHIPPSDQMLNTLLSKAHIALQLSTREGFEIKVSEALHKGIPVVATLAGGIPLQVQNNRNGFLVEVGDTDAVANHLYELWTDGELYNRMSAYAAKSVSDEVSTVGNALNWLYLGSEMTKERKLKTNERWVNDMAREEAGEPYGETENRLKRDVKVRKSEMLK